MPEGRRLAAASGKRDYAWEFVLLQGKEVNAFALPGGKTAVFTGLLPVARWWRPRSRSCRPSR